MHLRNQEESSSYVYENMFFTKMPKEVNLGSLHHKEEKEMKNLFHIKIHAKNTIVDAQFDYDS